MLPTFGRVKYLFMHGVFIQDSQIFIPRHQGRKRHTWGCKLQPKIACFVVFHNSSYVNMVFAFVSNISGSMLLASNTSGTIPRASKSSGKIGPGDKNKNTSHSAAPTLVSVPYTGVLHQRVPTVQHSFKRFFCIVIGTGTVFKCLA